MIIRKDILEQMEIDLGLRFPFQRGQTIPVRNCWHFYTNGNEVDTLFSGEEEFRDGMNQIFIALHGFNVIILAFVLMDTHIHFILYGTFEECNAFIHEYIKRASHRISIKGKRREVMKGVSVSYRPITDDFYLKRSICYTVKNPPEGGISSMSWTYPWSSGALYFHKHTGWTSHCWEDRAIDSKEISRRQLVKLVGAHADVLDEITRKYDVKIIDGIVFPGIYVAYETVEKLFKTCKSMNYFMCSTKEEEIESQGGMLSLLSLPAKEMKENRDSVCLELFGHANIRLLNVSQRVQLTKALRARYNSSLKQILRLCGLSMETWESMK